MTDSNVSDRSRGVALALACVIGPLGAHRFYVGKAGTGTLQLLTFGGLGVWWLYDLITICSGVFRDAEGKRVRNWLEADTLPVRKRDDAQDEKLEVVLEDLDACRAEIAELAERVDFMERVLARVREHEALPPRHSPH